MSNDWHDKIKKKLLSSEEITEIIRIIMMI